LGNTALEAKTLFDTLCYYGKKWFSKYLVLDTATGEILKKWER